MKVPDGNDILHAMIKVGDSMVMLLGGSYDQQT
jgi:hypothetical protein